MVSTSRDIGTLALVSWHLPSLHEAEGIEFLRVGVVLLGPHAVGQHSQVLAVLDMDITGQLNICRRATVHGHHAFRLETLGFLEKTIQKVQLV